MKVTKFLILTALILGGLVSAFGLTINNLSPAPKYEAANLLDSFTNSENFGITNFLNSNPGNDSLVPQAGRPDIAWMRGGPVSISQGQRTIYSPNGQMVAVYNGVQVKVHRVSDGLLLLTVNSIANGFDCQNPQMAPSFAFSPDSQKLVTMVDAPQPVGKAIQFWNLSNRTLESSITASGNSGVAFSPDGTKLIAGRSIYKVSDGTLLFFFPLGRYPAFYSPNGQFIYGSTYDTCSSSVNFAEFNGSTYSFIRNIGAGAGTPQTISPDGRYLINNYPGDVIQVSDGSVIASLGASGPNPYHTYTFSPNGQYVAIGRAFYRQLGQDPILIIRRTSDWSIVRSYNVDETVAMTDPGVVAAAFSPDSATVATTTWDTKLWSVADGSFIKGLSPIYASGVNAVAFSPDGQTIATATSETAGRLLSNIQLWNTADGSRKNINFLQTQGANISQVIFTPNGQNLLTFGGGNGQFSLQLWNANTGAFVRNYTFAGNGPIALSPDGQTIAVGNSGSAYNFYRLSDGTSLPFSISSAGGSGVYSPDGQIFAAYGGDFKMKLFNANNGAFIREITTGASANGGGPSRFPGCTSFSPDGTMIGIATEETNNFPRSGFIKLYRVSDGTLIRSLGQFDNWAACFTFTKDNQYVIATGWDATVRIWRISDGAQLQTYTSETGFQPGSNYALGQIALSPDGSKFAYVRADAAFVLASNPYYTPPTYSISGTITRNGSPLSGAAVALTGASSANATTDASGNYSFTNLASGNYTVTPSLANHSFAPGLISFSPLSTNQTTANFAATLNCTYSLTPSSPQSVGAAASTLNVTVTTPAGCAWTAASNSAFLTVTGGTSGNQTGTVNISIAANTGAARSGTLTIAGQTYTINQPDGTQPCTYTLNPTSASVSNAAGGGSFGVSTQAGCQWSAQSSSSFLTTNSTGTGPGTVNYSYAANSGAARSATITVGGQTFTLNQAAGTTNCPTCVAVSLPAVNASQNTTVTVPVTVGDTTGRGITAFDFDLRFDSSIVRPLAAQPVDNAGTVSSNFTITPNAGTAGRLVVSGFGINPLAGAGTLLNLKFEVIGSAQQVAALTWQTFQFNEGDPAAAPTP